MQNLDLVGLGLKTKYSRLAKLQEDLASFRARHAKAAAQAQVLQAHIPRARNADIEAASAAVLAGRKPPEQNHESDARRDHERAVKERDVLAHALQSLEEQFGNHLAQCQRELFGDVLQARDQIGREVAENARAAMSNYARWADLAGTIKGLAPPPPSIETGPPGSDERGVARTTNSFIGMFHTQPRGISRGTVEQVLGYLADLAPEEAGDDAAA